MKTFNTVGKNSVGHTIVEQNQLFVAAFQSETDAIEYCALRNGIAQAEADKLNRGTIGELAERFPESFKNPE